MDAQCLLNTVMYLGMLAGPAWTPVSCVQWCLRSWEWARHYPRPSGFEPQGIPREAPSQAPGVSWECHVGKRLQSEDRAKAWELSGAWRDPVGVEVCRGLGNQRMRLGMIFPIGCIRLTQRNRGGAGFLPTTDNTWSSFSGSISPYLHDQFSWSQGRIRTPVKGTGRQVWADPTVTVLLFGQRILILPFWSHSLSENLNVFLCPVFQGV